MIENLKDTVMSNNEEDTVKKPRQKERERAWITTVIEHKKPKHTCS